MNSLSSQKLAECIKTKKIPAKEIKEGDVLVDDFGAYIISQVTHEDGLVEALDAYNSGGGFPEDRKIEIIPQEFLRKDVVDQALENQRYEMRDT